MTVIFLLLGVDLRDEINKRKENKNKKTKKKERLIFFQIK